MSLLSTLTTNRAILVGLGACVVVLGGVLVTLRFLAPVDAPSSNHNQALVKTNTTSTLPAVTTNVSSPAVNGSAIVTTGPDQDGDGLTEEEETVAGTSDEQIDTDADGLNDREEQRIYHTNPLSTDTDGDGYVDGEEVKNLFNPNGPGRLYQLD